jgi:hypothetical protein
LLILWFILIDRLPGRFRYDRDSEEEEEDEDYEEWTQRNRYENDEEQEPDNYENTNDSSEHDNQTEANKYQKTETNRSQNEYFNNENKRPVNKFQANYNNYRLECSRIMPNDAYEPDSVKEPDQNNETERPADLRSLLRSRALNKHEHTSLKDSHVEPYDPCYPSNDKNVYYNPNVIEDENFEYQYQPITKPISVEPNDIRPQTGSSNFRANRWSANSNWSGNSAGFRNRYGNFRSNDRRGFNNNSNNHYVDEDLNGGGDTNRRDIDYDANRKDETNEERNKDDEEDEEEEEFIRNKKLRSIVVARPVVTSASNTDSVGSSKNNCK